MQMLPGQEKKPETPTISFMRPPLRRALSFAGLIILLLFGAFAIVRGVLYIPTAVEDTKDAIASPFVRLFGLDEDTEPEDAILSETISPVYVYSTPTSSGSQSAPVSSGARAPSGPADLSVRILGISGGRAQFEIRNDGGSTAPSGWIFTASLPTPSGYTYTSSPQRALAPGDAILNTLDWSRFTYGYSASAYITPCVPTYAVYPHPYQYTTVGPTFYEKYAPYCGSGSYYGSAYTAPRTAYMSGSFSVTVDPYRAVIDNNRANNTARAR